MTCPFICKSLILLGLNKVKDRLKELSRRISKFANILAEAHGIRTHVVNLLNKYSQYLMRSEKVKVKDWLKTLSLPYS